VPEPEITAEQIRDAFLVGSHKRVQRPASPGSLQAGENLIEYRRRDPTDRPLSAKWYMIMTMQLRGLTNKEIAARIHCSEQRVSTITHTERYRGVLEARMKGLDVDIINLKPKAIEALAGALVDPNRDTALRAARTYFEMTGQGTFGGKGGDSNGGGVGAVALAKALVAEARTEVHVHVNGGPAQPTPITLEAAPAGSIEAQPPTEEAPDREA
jgi:hypothetical protein